MASLAVRSHSGFTKRLSWAGYLLGFGLGGFFDGILLHQVLQWHHLLIAVEAPPFQDIRIQILADGLFHVLMYIITAVGLWLLWRTRREFAEPSADRLLLATTLIGFGVWHVLDGVLSHWILGIHRIRMDVENRLFWDLLWFFAFGVVFIAAGWLLRRNMGSGGSSGGLKRVVAPAVLTFAVLVTGPLAALPPPGIKTVMVLFRPGITVPDVFAAMDAVDGRVVWNDSSGQLWAVDLSSGGDAMRLYRHGALWVSNSFLPVGCFNWLRV